MKKFMMLAVLMSGNLMAGERTLLEDSKAMSAEVSNKTVICSALGYGMAELKINIKALDGWTILDHSNSRYGDRDGIPCMTAGACKPSWDPEGQGFKIEDIIQNNPRIEKIVVKRKIIEVRNLFDNEQGEKSCFRNLREELETVVGGIPFFHARVSPSEELPAKSCKF